MGLFDWLRRRKKPKETPTVEAEKTSGEKTEAETKRKRRVKTAEKGD